MQIENHPSVVFLPPAHVWQLTPHPPPVSASSTQPSSFGRKSLPSSSISKDPITIVLTLNVQVKTETTDSEILELTRWCREKCGYALLGAGGNLRSGTAGSRGAGGGGQKQMELTVQVVRFEEARALQAEIGHGHDHGHGHSHDHGSSGGHGHDHDHGHGHEHSHANGHESKTEHSASHDGHRHGSHSHDHGSNSHGHHH